MSKIALIVLILTLFSLAIRLFRVTEPPVYYFDEVYHAVTAKGYALNNPDSYDPFAPSPQEGTAYDWLHPPLAKLIQAGSIKVIGDNPLGWRLPSVIFGTLVVPLTFVLGTLLFGPAVGVFAAAVISFENLTFVMSRITMNDIFLIVFILSSFIFARLFDKTDKFRYLFITSLFLGFSVATKWPGVYAIAVIFAYLSFGSLKRRVLNFKLAALLVVPFLVYVLSYGQFWLQGNSVSDFVNLHKQIWWYQNKGDLVHSYGTTPLFCVPEGLEGPRTLCPWILDARTVYFSFESYGDKAGFIYALGNPLIFWSGILGVLFLVLKFYKNKKSSYLLILFGYLIFWVPWIFSPRILFIYHYLPSIPFMSIAIALGLFAIYKTRYKYFSFVILFIFALAFFYFYPITSGFPIDPDGVGKYFWLETWR